MAHLKRTQLAILIAAVLMALGTGSAGSPKFFPDDPIRTAVDSQDASAVTFRDIGLLYDALHNLVSAPGDPTVDVRAQNVNTVDEVPDSNWFTNRLGMTPISVDALLKGPDTTAGPAPGTWSVVAAKIDGVTPGFTICDRNGQIWFIKFDPPGYRAMATGTEMVVSKLMWALGYFVPEVHLAALRSDALQIRPDAMTTIDGRKRALKQSDLSAILQKAHRDADGSYRVIASKALEGQPVGGFTFYGTRSDDPNDVVAHEHRRELRAYGTFAAWLNHVDSKSINTLDTLVERNLHKVIQHHLLDFGSTIGSAGVYPREPYEGSEYLIEGRQALAGIPTFGLYLKRWRTASQYRSTTVGSFPMDNSGWDPEVWKPRYPNPAFRAARLDDKFWAARRLQLFTTEMLNAVTRVGQFGDPASAAAMSKFLVDRRNSIVRRYLPAVNPIVDVEWSHDRVTFSNAAVDADVASNPMEYVAQWLRFDNATGISEPIGATRSAGNLTMVPVPDDLPVQMGAHVRVEISALGGPASWRQPVHVYFVREHVGWKLIGFERVPAGNSPHSNENGDAQHN